MFTYTSAGPAFTSFCLKFGEQALRIGILTYHFSGNFGALIQAYGLREWLTKQGHQAQFVNYHPKYVEEGGEFDQIMNLAKFRKNLKIAYLRFSTLKRKLFGSRIQTEQFQNFRRDTLGVEGQRLFTEADLQGYFASPEGQFDMLICGSDQIWNPSEQKGLDPVYFLSIFHPNNPRRVAYAPSFGVPKLDNKYDDQLRSYLSKLDGLSAREQSGVDTIRRITGQEVKQVPDPAILLGDFSDLVARAEPVSSGHVFCYALRSDQGIRDVCKIVSQQFNARTLSPNNVHRRWAEIGETVYPSPAGWTSLIEKSRFVVTNTFHGTVLSVLLRKPFLAVALPGTRSGSSDRVQDLLGRLDLLHRFVEAGDMPTSKSIIEPIEWDNVRPLLEQMKNEGRSYLNIQLGSIQ